MAEWSKRMAFFNWTAAFAWLLRKVADAPAISNSWQLPSSNQARVLHSYSALNSPSIHPHFFSDTHVFEWLHPWEEFLHRGSFSGRSRWLNQTASCHKQWSWVRHDSVFDDLELIMSPFIENRFFEKGLHSVARRSNKLKGLVPLQFQAVLCAHFRSRIIFFTEWLSRPRYESDEILKYTMRGGKTQIVSRVIVSNQRIVNLPHFRPEDWTVQQDVGRSTSPKVLLFLANVVQGSKHLYEYSFESGGWRSVKEMDVYNIDDANWVVGFKRNVGVRLWTERYAKDQVENN